MVWFRPEALLLPDVIALNGRWMGDRPAIVCGHEIVSWADFATRCDQVAHGISDLGLRRGDRVAVLMRNSTAMAEILFGILHGGFVAVPLNVAVADSGIANMINDAEAKAVFASNEHTARIGAMRKELRNLEPPRFIAVEAESVGWNDYFSWRVRQVTSGIDRPSPSDECNIIYSSGTTGSPKGIIHSHACRMAWAYDMTVALRYTPGARTLCSLGLYSNISWVAMLNTLICGGTLVIMSSFDARHCLELIQEHRITHAAMVPVQFQRILALPDLERFDLTSLRSMMCCGSPLHVDTKAEIMARLPGEFIELYGLTEGLVTILSPEDAQNKAASVGRPCPGQDLKILGNDDEELGPNQAGEIVGYGRLQMNGYHNRPEANEEATWIDSQRRRWLRTGDIGHLDEDGFLYLVDRKKDMIISGGQNVYPADIEAVIIDHEYVREVAVIGVASERWGETPLAVIVPNRSVEEDELRDWVNARVGKQQRIVAVELVDALPRNPNGKVLKRKLREKYTSRVS